MEKKIGVFSDKDFLDWPRPPPLLTESKKKQFFYASPNCKKNLYESLRVPQWCVVFDKLTFFFSVLNIWILNKKRSFNVIFFNFIHI